MFSRSEKTEEATDAMVDAETQRSPMVLAALAGLLAIAGAFLLVFYLNRGGDDVAAEATDAAAVAASRQVLVVTQTIPRGTSVEAILEAPTVYLSARAVPEEFVAASAITSVAELEELRDLTLSSDALPGEQLLRGRFVNLSDFDSDTSFLDEVALAKPPDGHHAVVLSLPATQALGGNIRASDKVTIVGNFRVGPPGGTNFEVSTVVLHAVEVLSVDGSIAVAGQASDDVNEFGIATQGTFAITVAVEPDELTDLTFAMNYGDITLASALPNTGNDDLPRAATTMAQIIGADGVWLAEPDDGNVIDFSQLFVGIGEQGESIEVELPGAAEDGDAADDTEDATLVNDEDEEDEAPGDS